MSVLLKSVRNTYAPVPDHSLDVIKRNKVWDKAKRHLSFIHSSQSSTLTTCIWTYIHKLLWGCGVFSSCPAHTAHTAHGQVSQVRNEQPSSPAHCNVTNSGPTRCKFTSHWLRLCSLCHHVWHQTWKWFTRLRNMHCSHCPSFQILNYLQGRTLIISSVSSSVFASYAFYSHFC